MTNLRGWLNRRIDDVMALLMAMMFCVFIVQIITRYLAKYQLGSDFGWTMDFSSTCMVWLIFFGGAFALIETDHVKFDMIYNLFSTPMRKVLSILTSLTIVALFAWSLPAVWAYLAFLYKIGKPNSTMRNFFTGELIYVSTIYSIYLAFAVAIIWRYTSRAIRLMMGHAYETLDGPPVDLGADFGAPPAVEAK
jgi:C4-dicarboxylate transporter, DctQ subunit